MTLLKYVGLTRGSLNSLYKQERLQLVCLVQLESCYKWIFSSSCANYEYINKYIHTEGLV